jgi:hypothetical protein
MAHWYNAHHNAADPIVGHPLPSLSLQTPVTRSTADNPGGELVKERRVDDRC